MSRQRNKDSLSRRHAKFAPQSRLLIVCEGKVTEPRYLKSLISKLRSRIVEVEIVPEAGVPKTLVDHAVLKKHEAQRASRRFKDQNYLYDEVWCVFDVDQHPNLNEAKQQAAANGLQVAISNPCIELWGVFHFQDQFAFEERNRVTTILKQHIPGYVKEFPFDILWPLYATAVSRAQRVDHWHGTRGTEGANPSTGFYLLTERIRTLSKDELIKRFKD